jgi:hypothetical protein
MAVAEANTLAALQSCRTTVIHPMIEDDERSRREAD